MMRSEVALVLIVEGQSDHAAMAEHLDRRVVGIVIADGKENALRASEILDGLWKDLTIRVLVDCDVDGVRGHDPRAFATAARDLDTELLMAGGVLERVYRTLAYRPYSGPVPLSAVVAAVAAPLTALLRVAPNLAPGLRVAGLKLAGHTVEQTLIEGVEKVVRQAMSRSNGAIDVALNDLIASTVAEAGYLLDSLALHQGHCVHEALASVVISKGRAKDIQMLVHGCIWPEEFRLTSVGVALSAWADESGQLIWTRAASTAA